MQRRHIKYLRRGGREGGGVSAPVWLVPQVNEDDIERDSLVEESQPGSLTKWAPCVRITIQNHWLGAFDG